MLRAGFGVEGTSYIHNRTVSFTELEGSDKSCAVIAVKTVIDKEVKTRF